MGRSDPAAAGISLAFEGARNSGAGGVAVGLFCGLIPGPLQMLGAGVCAVVAKVNLPVALLVTLYTNPLTIVPLYLLAYRLGSAVLGAAGDGTARLPPEFVWSQFGASVAAYLDWARSLGAPLALGVPLLATLLAGIGYGVVRLAWSLYSRRAWVRRRRRRVAP
jgi:uncharacterized protein